jgi:DNA polymerase-1
MAVKNKRYKIIAADLSQAEPRIFAHYSGEKRLQSVFDSDDDFYSVIAIDVMGLKGVSSNPKDANFLKKVAPDMRQLSKVIALAIPYGSMAFQIAAQLGYMKNGRPDTDRAQKLIDLYLRAYPNLHKYMKRQELLAKKQGYVTNLFGRVRRVDDAMEIYKKYGDAILDSRWAKSQGLELVRKDYKKALNIAKNNPIQSTAADIVNRGMIEMSRYITDNNLDASIRLQIHDELICIAEESIAEHIAEKLEYFMCNNKYALMLDVKLEAEAKIGNNLVEVK